MPVIRMTDVCKRFGDAVAADRLNLEVEDGEYLCILGPTGAGKTTAMRMICGLTLPDSGTISFDGEDVTELETAKRGATMLSQQYSLFPHMSVMDNIMFGPMIKEWDPEDSKKIAANLLHMVHLESRSKERPTHLSGGQQQRVALARAMASGSRILLLDEPLRALDARLRLELRKDLKSMVKSMGLTAVHVTHDQDEALEMADRIAVIRNGRILQVGTPREVFDAPATPFVANFVGRSNVITGKVSTREGDTISVDCGPVSVTARDSVHGIGDDVVVAVKIGNTRISKKEEGFFSGRIERILYEGVSITVEIAVEGLGLISSKLPNRKFDDYSEGDEVSVRWMPSAASVFDIPECGLEEELRVE